MQIYSRPVPENISEKGNKRGARFTESTGTILKRYGIRPVKSLGQNFLADGKTADRIVREARVGRNDCVLEIGAGVGTLTARLAECAGRVVAVEIDRKLIPALEETLSEFENTVILNNDVLKLDLHGILEEYTGKTGRVKVVANLPYYITTPILMKLLEGDLGIHGILVMVQKEVADRLTACPGTSSYGALTVSVGYYSRPETVMNVSPGCFIPPPDVRSAVVRIGMEQGPQVNPISRELFFLTVKAAFGQRRKKLTNALFNSGNFNISRNEIVETLKDAGIEPGCRGETLSIVQFAKLSDSLYKKIVG